MKAPVFPIFSLKARGGLVIAAGGGGNKRFGKSNGVVVLDENTHEDLAFYETDDIIVDVDIHSPSDCVEEVGEDEMSWEEYGDESVLRDAEPGETEGNRFSRKVRSDIGIEEIENKEEGRVGNVQTDSGLSDISRRDSEKCDSGGGEEYNGCSHKMYLGCRGEKYYYLLQMENLTITLMKKIERTVSYQLFAKDLYLICDKTLYGFYNVTETPDALNDLLTSMSKKRRKNSTSLLSDESYEEYSYRLFRKDRRIVYKREDGRSDILNNWEKFFVTGKRIHKVVNEDGKYTFVYNSKKFSYEKEIGDIVYRRGALVYYLKGRDSVVYFQNESEKVYSIPMITTMGWGEEYISIGTSDGYIYLFKGSVLKRRSRMCDVPISGVVCMGGRTYFASIDGLIDTRPIPGGRSIFYLLAAIIVLILAIVIGVAKFK
jgi:hypothetical protein